MQQVGPNTLGQKRSIACDHCSVTASTRLAAQYCIFQTVSLHYQGPGPSTPQHLKHKLLTIEPKKM